MAMEIEIHECTQCEWRGSDEQKGKLKENNGVRIWLDVCPNCENDEFLIITATRETKH